MATEGGSVKILGLTILVFTAMCALAFAAVRLADEPFWVEPTWRTFQVPGGNLECYGRSQHMERYDLDAQCIFDPYGYGPDRQP